MLRCLFCKREITKDQIRGKTGKRCVKCAPKGAMPETMPPTAPAPKKVSTKTKAKAKTKIIKPKASDVPETITALKALKKSELISLAESLGSSSKGNKDELVDRLIKKLKLKPLR